MTTQQKKGMSFGTIAVLLVIMAGAGILSANRWSNPFDKLQGNERHVTVSAIWTPSPRAAGHDVRIETNIGGTKDTTLRNTAPFSQTYTVLKGDRVDVTAVIRSGPEGTLLGCSIAVNGTEVVSDHKNNVAVNVPVHCWVVVV